jgi:anti-sigma B factor antagonist
VQIFKLSESDLRPGCRRIEVEGELDLAVADQLQEAIDRAASQPQVLIDLGRCDFIDSTGIAVIVRAHGQMAEEGRKLAVCCASDQVLRVLTVTGLAGNGLVFATAESALAPDAT